jgi:hypothetical protein
MASEPSILDKIAELQNEYYSTSGKNLIFKSKQKQDCAAMVSGTIGLEKMLSNTVYVLPNTNKVYFDYTVFKLYANPSNYDSIIQTIIRTFDTCIDQYGDYESHMNLNTFTISALERYKPIIITFCKDFLKNNPKYIEKLARFNIYNTPSMIDMAIHVVRPFVNESVLKKVVFISKIESEKLISELLQPSYPTLTKSI